MRTLTVLLRHTLSAIELCEMVIIPLSGKWFCEYKCLFCLSQRNNFVLFKPKAQLILQKKSSFRFMYAEVVVIGKAYKRQFWTLVYIIYKASKDEFSIRQEKVTWVRLHRRYQTFSHLVFNSHLDNRARKFCFLASLRYNPCLTRCVIRKLRRRDLESIAKRSYTQSSSCYIKYLGVPKDLFCESNSRFYT
jgi:hypothetical protein